MLGVGGPAALEEAAEGVSPLHPVTCRGRIAIETKAHEEIAEERLCTAQLLDLAAYGRTILLSQSAHSPLLIG